jgi:hypothetical protein
MPSAVLTDLADGARDAVLVYHVDRLTRWPIELEQFLDVLTAAKVRHVRFVAGGDLDIGNGDGLMVLRMLLAVAANESATKSRRVKRKMEQNASAGLPHGGYRRPFGYADDKITIAGRGRGHPRAGRAAGGRGEPALAGLVAGRAGHWPDVGGQPRWLREPRGHRAVGVGYDPDQERWGNYVPTVLGERYDALLWFPEPRALSPLHGWPGSGEPETWPAGPPSRPGGPVPRSGFAQVLRDP